MIMKKLLLLLLGMACGVMPRAQNYYADTQVHGTTETYAVQRDSHGRYIISNVKNKFVDYPMKYLDDGTEVPGYANLGMTPKGGFGDNSTLSRILAATFTPEEIRRLKMTGKVMHIEFAVDPSTCRTIEVRFMLPDNAVYLSVPPVCWETLEKNIKRYQTWWPYKGRAVNYISMITGFFRNDLTD